VAEGVVDGLEMIDIQHRQVVPVLVVIAAPSLLPGRKRFMHMLFQPPAVHQAGQRVLFAVVEKADEVLVDPQHALDHAQLGRAPGLLAQHQNPAGIVSHGFDGHEQVAVAILVRQVPDIHGLNAGRVRYRRGKRAGAGTFMDHLMTVAVVGPFQGDERVGLENMLERLEQAHLQGQLIALLGQGDDVAQERFG
jgi:hypothetical protein